MAYDVVVGKSSKVKETPDIVASIEFSALKHIKSLAQKCDCVFLNSLSNFLLMLLLHLMILRLLFKL